MGLNQDLLYGNIEQGCEQLVKTARVIAEQITSVMSDHV